MRKDDLYFDIKHLDKYSIVTEPCTAIVRCNSTPDFNKPYTDDGHDRWIINLKAIPEVNLEVLKEVHKNNLKVKYSAIGYLFLSGAIWYDQIWEETQLPVKGENVIATFDYVKDKLMCTNITVIPKVNLKEFSASEEVLADIKYFKNLK